MKIEQIELKNYRQYRDAEINLAYLNGDKNITVIQGTTGTGKTNILNAITWCLYGKEMHMRDKYKGLPILNTMVAEELDLGKTCDVEVKIHIRDDDDKLIIINRILKFKKESDGEIIKIHGDSGNSEDGSEVNMMRMIHNDMKQITGPDSFINKMIPQNIEEYFFFDGERLDAYFAELSGEKIKEAVFDISQLGLLEKAIRHLEERKKNFLGSAKNLNSIAQQLKEKKDTYEKSLDAYIERRDKKLSQKEKAIEVEREYSDKLRTCGISNVKERELERVSLKDELTKLDANLDDLMKDKFDYLIEKAPAIFAYRPIIKTLNLIKGTKEAGDIPPKFKKYFLVNLLKDGRCICGEDISEKALDVKYRENILKLQRASADISNISEEIVKTQANLGSLVDKLKEFPVHQARFAKRINEIEESIKKKNDRMNKINDEIKGLDVEQITEWEYKLKETRELKDRLIGEIAESRVNIESTRKIINNLETSLEKELRKEKKFEELNKILTFCDQNLVAAKDIKKEIIGDLRKDIEERTRNQFFDLIWKKETYKDIRIDEDYNVSVIHQSGVEGIGTLSAGERQVLALAFMAALNSVSGFNIPIIIDTPLGRLGKEPKKNIAMNLPNYLKDRQITLLVTEEEYTPEVREKLSKRVGKEYKIIFEETKEGGQARVIQYG